MRAKISLMLGVVLLLGTAGGVGAQRNLATMRPSVHFMMGFLKLCAMGDRRASPDIWARPAQSMRECCEDWGGKRRQCLNSTRVWVAPTPGS